MQFSDDLRRRLVIAAERFKGSNEQLAKLFGISRSGLQKVLRQYRQRGHWRATEWRHGPLSKIDQQRLLKLVKNHPEMTLKELAAALESNTNSVGLMLKRLGWEKKRVYIPARGKAKRPRGSTGKRRQMTAQWTRAGRSSSK